MLGYTQAFVNVNKLNLSYTIDNLCAFRRIKYQDTIQIPTIIVSLVIYFHARIYSSIRKCKQVKFKLLHNRQSVCIQTY